MSAHTASAPRVVAANPFLIAGGVFSAVAALLHLAAIVGGPSWYRFFGAGEHIARLAERHSPVPAVMTVGIAAVLALAAAYAFGGAGLIRRLPLTRPALLTITGVYLARGLVVVRPSVLGRTDLSLSFLIWTSLISLAAGLAYAVGTLRAWRSL